MESAPRLACRPLNAGFSKGAFYTERSESAAIQDCSAGLRPAYFAAHKAAPQQMTYADLWYPV